MVSKPSSRNFAGSGRARSSGESVRSGDLGRAKPPPRLRRAVAGLVLIGLSVGVGLVLMDVFLRVFPQFQVQTGTGKYIMCSRSETRHQPHPRFGYTEVPGNSYFEQFSPQDPWNYVSINEEGFRDNHPRIGDPVIVLGEFDGPSLGRR